MSATRDRSQKTTFVFTSLYDVYKKAKTTNGLQHGQVIKSEDLQANQVGLVRVREFQPASLIGKRVEAQASAQARAQAEAAATEAQALAERTAAEIVSRAQAQPLEQPAQPAPLRPVPATTPAQAITSPEQLPKSAAPVSVANPAIDSLKKNLSELNDLHSRLRFMLKELEDLVKDKK